MSSLHDKSRIIVEGVFFQLELIDAAEAVLVEEPLDRLDHVQLGLHPEKYGLRTRMHCIANLKFLRYMH